MVFLKNFHNDKEGRFVLCLICRLLAACPTFLDFFPFTNGHSLLAPLPRRAIQRREAVPHRSDPRTLTTLSRTLSPAPIALHASECVPHYLHARRDGIRVAPHDLVSLWLITLVSIPQSLTSSHFAPILILHTHSTHARHHTTLLLACCAFYYLLLFFPSPPAPPNVILTSSPTAPLSRVSLCPYASLTVTMSRMLLHLPVQLYHSHMDSDTATRPEGFLKPWRDG